MTSQTRSANSSQTSTDEAGDTTVPRNQTQRLTPNQRHTRESRTATDRASRATNHQTDHEVWSGCGGVGREPLAIR